MTDHPAIVALARARYERDCDTDASGKIVPWDELPTSVRGELIDLSALDYAAVLRDLISEKDALALSSYRAQVADEIIRARAREIGVEI